SREWPMSSLPPLFAPASRPSSPAYQRPKTMAYLLPEIAMHPIAFALLATHASAGLGTDAAAIHTQLAAQVGAAFDSARGGFVTKAGMPVESAVELAFQQAGEHASGPWLEEAQTTMRWTHGLMDTLIGGYVNSASEMDATGTLEKRADLNGRR